MDETMNIPRHVAIIPDGNRRWAKDRGLAPWEGHEAGAKNTEEIVRAARELGIRELSFWGSSIDNLVKRPVREKAELLAVYERHFRALIDDGEIFRDRVRVRCIGRWKEQFPDRLRNLLIEAEDRTKDHGSYALNFFLAYSGKDDMLQAFRNILSDPVAPELMTEERVKSALMTRDIPPVDFLIRTGGDAHLSAGFLMWDTADAQLLFSDLRYPDFGVEPFRRAVSDYGRRERRYGK